MGVITLITDFGTRDWFAATLHGVILGISPRAKVVDITHQIPPGDICSGAFALRASYRYFPKGTVHVAVVDPGVGSPRRPLAVQTVNNLFVGPDNGLLSWALAGERIKSIRQLENADFFLNPVSRTFHGRDIFAPVAAHLDRGAGMEQLGRELDGFIRQEWPKPARQGEDVVGQVIYIDHFGNAITNIERELVPQGASVCEVAGKRKARCRLAPFYGAVPVHRPVAVLGSSGLLEMAVNGGSIAQQFGVRIGDPVIVRRAKLQRQARTIRAPILD